MKCWSCGGGIPDGSNFCGLCGARQNPTDRISQSDWMRGRPTLPPRPEPAPRLGLPSLPPPPDDAEMGRVTELNPAILVDGAPEPVALVMPETALRGDLPRFAALAAVARPAVLLERPAPPLPPPTALVDPEVSPDPVPVAEPVERTEEAPPALPPLGPTRSMALPTLVGAAAALGVFLWWILR